MNASSILTPDFLSSQKRAGATATQIANIVAKHDQSFAGEYNLIKQKAERYDNPEDFVNSFLNYKVHGNAAHQEVNPVDELQARYDQAGPAGFSRNDILNSSNPLAAGAKTAANLGVGVAESLYKAPMAAAGMLLHPKEALKSAATAISGGIADAYQGVTGNQMPTFKAGGSFGNPNDITTDGPTPEQQQFKEGFFNKTLGVSDALRGDVGGAADRVVTNLITDPASTALALSPLTRPRPIDPATGLPQIDPATGKQVVPSYLGPISNASDAVGKGIATASDALRTSAENSIAAAKQKFARELVSPKETAAVKLEQVSRTTEKGKGLFKRDVVQPTKRELAMEEAVADLPLNPKGTFQQNYNIVKEHNIAEAEGLKTSLAMNDFPYSRSELKTALRKTRDELKRNPVLVGDSAKVANKLIEELDRRIEEAPNNGSSLLQVRKDFDDWVESQKGSAVFDPAKENAFSSALRPLRQTINDFLEAKAPDLGVKKSFARQTSLFNAMDNIAPKAALEANSAWERVAQKVHAVSGKLRLGPTGVGVTGVAGAYGVYAAPQLAAILGGLTAGAYLVYKGGKAIMSPRLRLAASDILHILEKVAISDPKMLPEITPIIQDINSLRNGQIPSIDDIPLSQLDPQGVTDAAQAESILQNGGSFDDALKTANDNLPQ